MRAESFIAKKIRFRGPLAVCAVALSFFVIIVSLAVARGYRSEIYNSLRDLSGDIVVPTDSPISGLDSLPGVEKSSAVLYKAGIVKIGDGIKGVLFKGEDSDSSSVPMGVRIPSALAEELGLKTGDKMLTYFVGEKLKVRRFTVTDIYTSVFESSETLVAKLSLSDLQRIGYPEEGAVSAMELRVHNGSLDRRKMREKAYELTFLSGHFCQAVPEKYPNVFDWLDLIDVNVRAILILMILVAGFNMISGLLIMLLRNIPTIGILKTLGMSSRQIAGVFLRVGARVVGLGMLAGNALAVAFCIIQSKTQLLTLDAKNYFLSFVPVDLSAGQIILCDAIAFCAILILLLFPCIFISKTDPAKTVKVS